MGATCSSCCWSDRRASDVLVDNSLQDKLLDTSDYGGNSTLIEDSPGNPYARSESRMKESWPRPEASPTSVYTHGDRDDDDSDHDETDHSECDSDARSSASAHSMTGHAWNLREAASASDSGAHTEQLSDDDNGDAASGYALRAARAISAAQSVRSSASDSYASTRNLPTYESQLFADDQQSRSPTRRASQESDDEDSDDGDRTRASTSAFSDRQLSSSQATNTSSSASNSASDARLAQRKRSY